MQQKKTLSQKLRRSRLVRFWVNEWTVITLIFISTLVLFLDEFPNIHDRTKGILLRIDYACILFFIIEILFKIGIKGFRKFWRSRWNKIDFIIILLSLPSLLVPLISAQSFTAFTVFLVLRLSRLVRFFRILRFIPNTQHIYAGLIRALKASVGIFVILFILNLAFAMGATMLFGKIAPEYFGDPLISSYTLFKVFTLEGWFEIPDAFAQKGHPVSTVVLIRLYFIVAVMVGGILGLSLANAIFVDEMTADNTYKVEGMVADLQTQVHALHEALNQSQQRNWEEVQAELREMRQTLETLKERKQ